MVGGRVERKFSIFYNSKEKKTFLNFPAHFKFKFKMTVIFMNCLENATLPPLVVAIVSIY